MGKSRRAHEELPDAYVKDPRTKWWNGYFGEKDVIIDDFGPGGVDINHLLRWFDRYKCLVENKGGMLPLLADKFVVTSNFHPSDVYKDKEGIPHPQTSALERRLNIIHMVVYVSLSRDMIKKVKGDPQGGEGKKRKGSAPPKAQGARAKR